MIGPRSWNEDYQGAEPGVDKGPSLPLYVEMQVGGDWELWAECEDMETAWDEAGIVKDHGFIFRVVDANANWVDVGLTN